MNKRMALVAIVLLAGSARSQMIRTVVAPSGAPAITVSAPLAASQSFALPGLPATPLALIPTLVPSAPALLAASPLAPTPVSAAPVKSPYDLPGPIDAARRAVANAGIFDGAKAAASALPVAQRPAPRRPLPRGVGLSEKEAVAKISADPSLGADELKVVFPDGTPEEARLTFARLDILSWLSPSGDSVALTPLPGGKGWYAIFTPASTPMRAAIAAFALARRPETQSVTLGPGLQRAWEALNR